MDPLVSLHVTAPDLASATALARVLVEERLVACVNVIPGVVSVYRWEGAVCQEAEVILVAKTRRGRLDAVVARVSALHPYDVPCVVALPVEGGHPDYLAWVQAVTDDDADD